ncbi:TonB-dependent receptor [Pseudoalteromonas haloplanktis]|uniref:TonB-dependent receptor n=1 Tax=Pseudoalteromonas haloplanktis TaxID=228 RepID=A0ABU1B9M8_PSEHA|nr:TonB-dependent receptor [Pseudoalteromonas haloplanktis]MDQ9090342.1 TonB-dependent receptor [Pseudoalteromonas haloplanktis]
MPKFNKLHTALLLAGCSFTALTNPVYANEKINVKQAEVTNKDSKELEVILVSAQKRDQALKDVPSSIQVLDDSLIEEVGIEDGFDLVTYLPGFGLDDSTEIRTTTLKTRGIGTFTNSIGLQSSNLVVIDGEVLPRQSMLNLPVSDVERVEAMRGPQGTLFGQNTSTGLLHYVTKKPEIGELTGKIRAGVSEFNGRDVSGTINLPIAEDWALRFNAQYSDIDGWIDNTMPGEEDNKVGAKTTKAGRAQLLYDAGEGLDVLFRLEYSETDNNCCSMSSLGGINVNFGPNPIIHVKDDGTIEGTTYNSINPSSTFEENGGPVTARNAEANYGSTENFGFSIAADYYLNDEITFSYNGSYRDFDLYNSSSFFTVNYPVERSAFGGNESVEVQQQEFRLSSFDNERFDWVVGLFYHDTKGQRSETRDGCIAGNRGLIENGVLAGCYSGPSTNQFLANYNSTGIDDRSLLVPQRLLGGGEFTTNFENIAIFGQLDYQITERFDATFGFRYLHEKGEATFARTDLRTPQTGVGLESFDEVYQMAQTDPSLIIRETDPTKFSDSDSAFIYKAVLGYDFARSVRGYVNYSTGYKGASYFVTTNTDPAEADNFPTAPELSSNFEVGLRSGFFDNDLLFNITYFDMSVEDYQVRATRVIDEDNNIVFAGYVNAAEARSTGIEADVVMNITDELKWSVSYAYFDARYEDFDDTPINCPAGDGGLLADRCTTDENGRQSFNQTGLSFENNAEQQLLSTIKYDIPLGNTGWNSNVQGIWRYNGSHTQSINELAFGESANPSSSIWDLYFNVTKGPVHVNFYVKNLFDKTYTSRQRINQDGFGEGFYPRDWSRYVGASIQYTF